jgi:hypothetical protein
MKNDTNSGKIKPCQARRDLRGRPIAPQRRHDQRVDGGG